MNNGNNNSQNSLDQAGQNTVHTAATIAAKGAATAAGGPLAGKVAGKAADAVLNTAPGRQLTGAAGQVIGRTPGLNQLNKGLNDSGAINAAANVADMATGGFKKPLKGGLGNNTMNSGMRSRPGVKPNNNNVPFEQSNGTSSDIPKPKNPTLPSRLPGKNSNGEDGNSNKRKGDLGGLKSGIDTEEDTLTNEEDEFSSGDDALIPTETRNKAILKLIVSLLPVIGTFILIILFVSVIASPVSAIASFFSLDNHGTDTPDYLFTESQAEQLDAEKKYNQAIIDKVNNYKMQYGVTLDKKLLHAILVYRFLGNNDSGVYDNTGSNDIPDNIEEELDNLEAEGNSDVEIGTSIDYSSASAKITAVADLMLISNGDLYTTDTEREGDVYNKLLYSTFLTSYYKDFISSNSSIEDKKKIVDAIYDLYEMAKDAIDETQVGFLSDTIVVYMQTCHQPYKFTEKNGRKVYDNQLVNEGTEYPLYLSMTDYIKGVIMGEVGGYMKEPYREGLKAFAITALTYILSKEASGFYTGATELYFPAGNCRQLTCDPTYGCTYTYDGNKYGTSYSGYNRFPGKVGHNPLTEAEHALLDGVLNEVFGMVMVKESSTDGNLVFANASHCARSTTICTKPFLGQVDAMEDAAAGMQYDKILEKYFPEPFKTINIKEDLYVDIDNYPNATYNGEVVFYSQRDYKQKFCGRTDGATISSSGCGVTSMSMILSTFINRSFTPDVVMKEAYSMGECGAGIIGTNAAFFKKSAAKYSLGYDKAGKSDANKVIEALRNANVLVIAHMGPGIFTDNGHYIVLSAVNEQGQVKVLDPNAGKQSGWHDFNTVVKQLKGSFHIISK